MTLDAVLDIIESHALEAGAKAEECCSRSKYSIQDYWMCIEFSFARLHDSIAREAGLSRRCKQSSFRQAMAAFRRAVISAQKIKEAEQTIHQQANYAIPRGCGTCGRQASDYCESCDTGYSNWVPRKTAQVGRDVVCN